MTNSPDARAATQVQQAWIAKIVGKSSISPESAEWICRIIANELEVSYARGHSRGLLDARQ